jgi:hypothetical protein
MAAANPGGDKMSVGSGSINGTMERSEVGLLEETREIPRRQRRSLREIIGLDDDRVGPIPGGVAAFLGSAIFWVTLVWVVFGVFGLGRK